MHRFFVEGVRELGDEVALAADDARKARVVLDWTLDLPFPQDIASVR